MNTYFKLIKLNIAFLLGIIFFVGCQQEEIVSPGAAIESRETKSLSPSTTTGNFYGLSPSNQILKFSLRPAYSDMGTVLIRGLRTGERIIAIDTRPVNRALYGVSNMSRIYLIDPATGMTKPVSATNFSPAIDGATVGFDFNQMTDRITLITDKGQTLTIHPTTGQVVATTTTNVTGINALANYGNAMYGIAANTGILYITDGNGDAKAIGSTGLTITGEGGLDSKNGMTIGVFNASGVVHNSSTNQDDLTQQAYRLYTINTSTGQASSLGVVKPMIGLAAQ